MNYISLNKSISIPIYKQIVESIHSAIERGDLKDRDPLPYEEDIARFYNISRVSVRMAYQHLVDQGKVIRIKRRGSFVNLRPTIHFYDAEMVDVYQLLTSRGLEVSERILLWDDSDMAKETIPFALRNEPHLTHFNLLIEADHLPYALVDVYAAQYFDYVHMVRMMQAPRLLYALSASLNRKPDHVNVSYQYERVDNIYLKSLRLSDDALVTRYKLHYYDDQDHILMHVDLMISSQHNIQDYTAKVKSAHV